MRLYSQARRKSPQSARASMHSFLFSYSLQAFSPSALSCTRLLNAHPLDLPSSQTHAPSPPQFLPNSASSYLGRSSQILHLPIESRSLFQPSRSSHNQPCFSIQRSATPLSKRSTDWAAAQQTFQSEFSCSYLPPKTKNSKKRFFARKSFSLILGNLGVPRHLIDVLSLQKVQNSRPIFITTPYSSTHLFEEHEGMVFSFA